MASTFSSQLSDGPNGSRETPQAGAAECQGGKVPLPGERARSPDGRLDCRVDAWHGLMLKRILSDRAMKFSPCRFLRKRASPRGSGFGMLGTAPQCV